jgi:uncharacterized membrane protein
MTPSLFPPLPSYEGLHPIVVHFPIALLLVTPLFILLAMAWKSQSRAMLLTALILSALGTAGAFLALNTGEATERFAELVPAAGPVLESHEELAEIAAKLAAGVTLVLGIVAAVYAKVHERVRTPLRLGGGVVLLLLAGAPSLTIARAAHEGGVLVHLHGVHAPVAVHTGSGAPATAPRHDDDD